MNRGDEPLPQLLPRTILRRVRGIAWRIVEEEAILVNVRHDEVIQLDPVGSFIWSKMDGQATLEEVARDIVEEFEVELEKAMNDLLAFAGRLLKQGAVELVVLE
jgi:hypothetical protein